MDQTTKTYEAMFLLDADVANFETATEPVRAILDRNKVEILSMKPWDERRLAYEIRGRKRGLYVLTYFRADPACITEIEHDCQLQERLLRTMILRQDKLTEEQINADTPATAGARRAKAAAEERAAAAERAAAEAGAPQATEAATDDLPDDAAEAEAEAEPAPQPAPDEAPTSAEASAEAPDDKTDKTDNA